MDSFLGQQVCIAFTIVMAAILRGKSHNDTFCLLPLKMAAITMVKVNNAHSISIAIAPQPLDIFSRGASF